MMPADIRSLADDVAVVAERSDSLAVKEAAEMMVALDVLASAVATAASLVRSRLVGLLAEPVLIDGRCWSRKADGRWKPQQYRVAESVVRRAAIADTDTGELRSPTEAANEAVRLMQSLYVSPSTMPKTGGLEALGLAKRDVASWDQTGWKLDVSDGRPA